MQKSEPYRTSELLLNLSSELMQLRSTIILYHQLFTLENREDLRLSDKIDRLWDELERCFVRPLLSSASSIQSYQPLIFDQKITLAQWAEDVNYFSEKYQISFIPSHTYQAIEIWRESAPDYPDYIEMESSSSHYWSTIFFLLSSWWKLMGTKLEGMNWSISTDTVELSMTTMGVFQAIKECQFQSEKFWIITFPANPPSFFQQSSDALLLGSQLIAQLGGNLLTPIELEQGQLTIKLKMQRADTSSSQPAQSKITNEIYEQVINHILVEIPTNYIEASGRLEKALSEELPHLEAYLSEDDEYSDWPVALQKVQSELALFREEVAKWDLGRVKCP